MNGAQPALSDAAAYPFGFAVFDWIVLGGYVIGLVAFGLRAARRNRRPSDYFLASRNANWLMIGFGLLATNMSSTALVGLSGAAYSSGISVYDYEWSAAVILALYAVFLVPFVVQARVFTMPEFLERRYDRHVRLYFTVLTLLLNVAVDCAGALYCGALVIQALLPGLPIAASVAAIAGAAGLYTIIGGMRAVIFTETVQAFVLIAGAVVVASASFLAAGGWDAVMTGVSPDMLSLIRPANDPFVPWPGLLLGIPLLGFYYWCTNQYIAQRVLSARDSNHARWGVLLAGLLKLPVLYLMVLPGTCALLLFPHLSQADKVYPALVFGVLPIGLKGLVAASLVAATMMSVASTLNAASTLVTMDVVARLSPGLSDVVLVRIGRVSGVVFLMIATIWAPGIAQFASFWQYIQGMLAYGVPPVAALFLFGLFWRGANAAGGLAGLVVGASAGALLFASNYVLHWTQIHFLLVAPILFGISAAVLVGVSRRYPAPLAAFAEKLIWTPGFMAEEAVRLRATPVWRDYRILAALLVTLTAAIVITFR